MLQRRYLIHLSLAVVALVIILYPYYKSKPETAKVAAASSAAVSFLQLLDAGEYEDAWHLGSAHLQTEIPLETWLEQVSDVRQQVGSLQQRSQTDVNYTRAPVEGIPEGEYLSFFYLSEFDAKKQAKERVTLYLETDGVWRVAGYFVE